MDHAHEEQLLGEAWLDRLVDGELGAEEERRLLEALDASPQGWKRCALGFLEARAWRSALKGLGTPRELDTPRDAGPPPHAALNAISKTARDEGSILPPRTELSRSVSPPGFPENGSFRSSRHPWLSLAASVALAFWAGRMLPIATTSTPHGGESGIVADVAAPANRPSRTNRLERADSTRFVNSDFWQGEPTVPNDIKKLLGKMNVKVQQRAGFVPAESPQGQPLIVPYQEVRLIHTTNRAN